MVRGLSAVTAGAAVLFLAILLSTIVNNVLLALRTLTTPCRASITGPGSCRGNFLCWTRGQDAVRCGGHARRVTSHIVLTSVIFPKFVVLEALLRRVASGIRAFGAPLAGLPTPALRRGAPTWPLASTPLTPEHFVDLPLLLLSRDAGRQPVALAIYEIMSGASRTATRKTEMPAFLLRCCEFYRVILPGSTFAYRLWQLSGLLPCRRPLPPDVLRAQRRELLQVSSALMSLSWLLGAALPLHGAYGFFAVTAPSAAAIVASQAEACFGLVRRFLSLFSCRRFSPSSLSWSTPSAPGSVALSGRSALLCRSGVALVSRALVWLIGRQSLLVYRLLLDPSRLLHRVWALRGAHSSSRFLVLVERLVAEFELPCLVR